MVTPTRRAALAGLAGLTLTAPRVSLANTAQRSEDSPASPHNVRAFGAKGNRRDLDDESFRQAIDTALADDQYPGTVLVPAGHYRRAKSIALPNHVALRGEGPSSVINSQNDDAFTAPILVNKSTAGAVSWRLSDFCLFSGSHGLKLDVSGEITDLRFNDVTMLMQSVANIEANKLFQTAKFFGGTLGSAPYGLKVNSPTTNAFNSFGLEWTDHSKCSMYLRGATVALVIGGRFEGGGRAGNATIDIEDGASITFIGVYFENVHEYLARLRRVKVVSFVNCHFTGTQAGAPAGLAPFKWDIDSNLLVFRDCHSTVPMPVPGNIVLDGVNCNIFPSHAVHEPHGLYGKISAVPRALAAAGIVELLAAIRTAEENKADGLYACDLVLTVAALGSEIRTLHRQAAFEIIEQDGGARIVLGQDVEFETGQCRISLDTTPGGRLLARYDAGTREGLPVPQLSWSVDWRRVAGGPVSSLMLYIP